MSWAYKAFDDSDVDKINADVIAELNTISNSGCHAAASAKIATSDQREGDARGIVFSNPAIQSQQLSNPCRWASKTESTRSDYTDMYNAILDAVNALSDQEAFFAKVTFSNRKDGDATMTLTWPTT